jgi:hypothetical protein
MIIQDHPKWVRRIRYDRHAIIDPPGSRSFFRVLSCPQQSDMVHFENDYCSDRRAHGQLAGGRDRRCRSPAAPPCSTADKDGHCEGCRRPKEQTMPSTDSVAAIVSNPVSTPSASAAAASLRHHRPPSSSPRSPIRRNVAIAPSAVPVYGSAIATRAGGRGVNRLLLIFAFAGVTARA